jgi:two-component system, NarL family, invasion response regulator UvrY
VKFPGPGVKNPVIDAAPYQHVQKKPCFFYLHPYSDTQMKDVKVVVVDDHKLFRRGIAELINDFQGYSVINDLNSGRELQRVLSQNAEVDIVLLDINMPEMSGYDVAVWLRENHSSIRVVAVSMDNKEQSILRMLKAGARGYVLKDADPLELRSALDAVMQKGYHHSELISASFINQIHRDTLSGGSLNPKELEFLELACSDLTYKEIADKMNLAPRTIDGYREALFQKLHVKSRVGLAMYAIKNNLISI